MMDTLDFCFNYVSTFLILMNYADDSADEMNLIENSREECLETVSRLELSESQRKKIIDEYNKSFDSQIFDFIKRKIADEDPTFFQEGINKLKELLNNFKEYAKSLNMTLDNGKLSIEDYYKNYLIALDYCLINSNEFEVENEEEEEVDGR